MAIIAQVFLAKLQTTEGQKHQTLIDWINDCPQLYPIKDEWNVMYHEFGDGSVIAWEEGNPNRDNGNYYVFETPASVPILADRFRIES